MDIIPLALKLSRVHDVLVILLHTSICGWMDGRHGDRLFMELVAGSNDLGAGSKAAYRWQLFPKQQLWSCDFHSQVSYTPDLPGRDY